MKTTIGKIITPYAFATGMAITGYAQGFVNLDFNSADIPPGTSSGTFVPISEAIPGWTGYFGTTQTSTAWYNDLSLGAVSIDILGTNGPAGVIPGNSYTVVLQAGFDGPPGNVTASIAQTALIPANTKSILFTASLPFQVGWQVAIAGQVIPISEVSTIGSDYAIYAGDVSTFANKVEELEFTALASPTTYSAMDLDAISFSSSPAPEPGEIDLTLIGAIFGFFRWRKVSR